MSEAAEPGLLRAISQFFLVRLLIFSVLLIVAYAGLQVLYIEGSKRFPQYLDEIRIGSVIATILVMIGLYALLVAWLERRRAKEISLLPGIPLSIGGALLGFALFATVFGILWLIHVGHWLGFVGTAGLGTAMVLSVGSAIGEEVVFRGAIFRIFEDTFGTFIAVVISAALFGLIHAGNKGATVFSSVAIALEAGALLAVCYTVVRNLWLPIGVHFGWNFTEGGIFGAAVSGGDFKGIGKSSFEGTDLLTGGKFGPEASIVAVGVCLVAALILAVATKQRGEWKPLSFRLLLP